jgi:hypothetical protein
MMYPVKYFGAFEFKNFDKNRFHYIDNALISQSFFRIDEFIESNSDIIRILSIRDDSYIDEETCINDMRTTFGKICYMAVTANNGPLTIEASIKFDFPDHSRTFRYTDRLDLGIEVEFTVPLTIASSKVLVNDHTCPTCKNDRCSKSEKSCWKCGNQL